MYQRCRYLPIAGSRACEVWLCEECMTIQLSIGPVSLKLKLNHFLDMYETLQSAVYQVRNMQADFSSQDKVTIPGSKQRH